MREIILAIKPKYAKMILDGTKTVELRKRFSENVERIFLYTTAPEKEIMGYVDVKNVHHEPLRNIWDIYHNKVGITEEEFKKYFGYLYSIIGWGFAVELENPIIFDKPIKLADLSIKKPPQSYMYCSLSEKLGLT